MVPLCRCLCLQVGQAGGAWMACQTAEGSILLRASSCKVHRRIGLALCECCGQVTHFHDVKRKLAVRQGISTTTTRPPESLPGSLHPRWRLRLCLLAGTSHKEAVALAASPQASVPGGGAWDGPVASVSCRGELVSHKRLSSMGITGQRVRASVLSNVGARFIRPSPGQKFWLE